MIGKHLEEAKEADDGLDQHYLDPNYGNEFDTQPYGEHDQPSNANAAGDAFTLNVLERSPGLLNKDRIASPDTQ